MADEQLEAVIKIGIDDSAVEGQVDAAVAKATKRASKGGPKVKVTVEPVIEDADLAKLKTRLNKAQTFLTGAQAVSKADPSRSGEGAEARRAMQELRSMISDLRAEIKRREGKGGPGPSTPVTDKRLDEVARFVRAAGVKATPATTSTSPTTSPPAKTVFMIPASLSAKLLEAERNADARARARAVPGSDIAREMGRTPSARTYRSRPGRDGLPGQRMTFVGRRGLNEEQRQDEAPRTEDTFNPIGERTRQAAPRRGPYTYAPGEALGAPGAAGPYGRRPGDSVPMPRGALGALLRRYQQGKFEDYFAPVDATGKIRGPASRATGELAARIKLNDPGYNQFEHEGGYLQRISPFQIAQMEREKLLDKISKETGVPKLFLANLGGELGQARTSRKKDETREAELKRRAELQRSRQDIAGRVQEDLYRFNTRLGTSKSGEGTLGPTGYLNVAQNVLPSPEVAAPLSARELEIARSISGGVGGKEGIAALITQARGAQSGQTSKRSRYRINREADARLVTVDDPTTAGLGRGRRTIKTTGVDSMDAYLGREVAETLNPRLAAILEGYKQGETMANVGPFGGTAQDVGQSQIRGSGGTIRGLGPLGTGTQTLSAAQTARHRIGQLVYDLTKSAGYGEREARGYQTGRLKIGSASKLDKSVKELITGALQSLSQETGAKRESADLLDRVQRDPRARGEKKRTYTEQDEPLEKLEQRLSQITLERASLDKTQEFTFNKEGVKVGSARGVSEARTESGALGAESALLRARRVRLRHQQEESLARVAQQSGGLLGERGGVRAFVPRDRTRTRVVRGRKIRAPGQEYMDQPGMQGPIRLIDELVPARGRAQFGEGRADSGDVYAAAADATVTGAATNLTGTATRPAEEPLVEGELSKKARQKRKDRMVLQDSRASGKPPKEPTTFYPAGYDGAPPPTGVGGPPAGGGGGLGIGPIHVIIAGQTKAVAVTWSGAKPSAAATAGSGTGTRRVAGERAPSLAAEAKAAKMAADAEAQGFTLVGKPYISADSGVDTTAEARQSARRIRSKRRSEAAQAEREDKARKAAEEKEARLNIAGTGPAKSQEQLLTRMRKEGFAFTPPARPTRPFEGRSPARIQAEAEILEARALNPTRAFQTAVAAAFAKTIGGGSAFEKRVKELTQALNVRADVGEKRTDIARDLLQLRAETKKFTAEVAATGKPPTAAQAEYGEGLREREAAIRARANQSAEDRVAANQGVAQRRRELITPIGVARGFAALGVGAIAGGLIFSAAQQAIQAAISVMADQASKAADALGGFALTASRVTAELADAVRQGSGNLGAIGGAAAPSGISLEAFQGINPRLTGRAQAIAAAQSRVQESDLFRSASFLGQDQLKGGYDRALFQGTGGIMNTQLFAPQPGLMERISDDLSRSIPTAKLKSSNPIADALSNIGISVGNAPSAGTGIPGATNSPETLRQINDLNDQLGRANSEFKYLTGAAHDSTGGLTENAKAMKKSADELGQGNIADKLISAGIVITGQGGRGLRGTEFGQAAADVSRGQLITDPRVAFEADKRGMQAQISQIQRQFEHEMNFTLPSQLSLGGLAAPLAAPGTGMAAANPAEQKQIEASVASTSQLQDQLNQRYQAGNKILQQYLPKDLYDSIKNTGEEIVKIQSGLANSQAALQAHEYSNQLRIAERSYHDILGLQGKSVAAGASQLGIAERQNVELSRQSELLSQQLSQRQINFQLAQANFQAPGLTSEQRAANIEQAQYEAGIAQKQLDLQKKAFKTNINIFNLQNVNAAVDALNSIKLLQEGRGLVIKSKDAEDKLLRLQKLQDDNVNRAGKYLGKVESEIAVAYSELAKLEAAYGKALDGITADTINGFITTIDAMYTGLGVGNIDPHTGLPVDRGGKTSGNPQAKKAAGTLFNTSGATSMIVGEAGTETVAVLRNPRMASLSGGGGGGVTININGPVVNSAGDIQKIARAVEQVLQRKASLIMPRRP